MASLKEAGNPRPAIDKEKFMPLYLKSIKIINKEFLKRKMKWSHGHFKPKEIFKADENIYYLTDFAHVKMYPEGYELAFIIWADYIMSESWKKNYNFWKNGIKDWIKDIYPIAQKLKIKNYNSLMRACLLERSLGTILADISANDFEYHEKIKRLDFMYKLMEDLINNKF